MEKEQKKLLLVAVSVGVFLLVTITVAIIILTPRVQTQETSFSSSQPPRIQPAETISPAPLQPAINNTQEITLTNNGNNDTRITADMNDGERLTIQIPRPTTAAVPDTPEAAAPAAAGTAPAATARPAPAAQPAATAPTATTRAVTPQPAPRASTPAASRTAAPARTVNDYWVQTGAFSAKIRAEDAKDLLASKGLVSIIENREINGSIWYRVRLGPYTSEREANYWLALVQTIDGFSGSQVRQTTRHQ